MGKIYSWERIENGSIPTIDDFFEAKKRLFNNLKGETDKVYGAKIYGSVAKNYPSTRSDLDVLIVVNDKFDFQRFGLDSKKIEEETSVEVEPLMFTKTEAITGLHSIDQSFIRHFQKIPNERNVFGKDPVQILRSHQETELNFCINYIRQKIRRFNQGNFQITETELLNILQRVLESPISVGRKFLETMQTEEIIELSDGDDSKTNVIENFRQTMDLLGESTDMFNELVSADKEYSQFLGETLQQKHSRKEYQQFLNEIKTEQLPKARQFVLEIGTILIRETKK